MKYRTGFISNSSSSSFILGIKGDTTEVELRVKVDLLEYGELISTEEGLENFYLDEYGDHNEDTIEQLFISEEYLKETYDLAAEYIRNGSKILIGNVSTDGGAVEDLLCNMGFPESDDYEVIEQTGW